jgi:hypothetical protein
MIGCLRAVTESDVPGDYQAKADWGTWSLTLSRNHTLQQTVHLNDGEIKQIKGRWTFVGPSGNSVNTDITFTPYLNVTHDKQGVFAPWSFLSIDPPIGFRKMQIAANPDWGIAHRKTN